MSSRVTVQDLRDRDDSAPRARVFLYCDTCGERNSATSGDYWNAPPWHVFKCCRRNMRLVTERICFADA